MEEAAGPRKSAVGGAPTVALLAQARQPHRRLVCRRARLVCLVLFSQQASRRSMYLYIRQGLRSRSRSRRLSVPSHGVVSVGWLAE